MRVFMTNCCCFLFFLLNIIFSINAQNVGYYKTSFIQDSHYVLELSINTENKYILDLSSDPQVGKEFYITLTISYGTCTFASDTLHLNDTKYNYSFKLVREKKSLLVIQGPFATEKCIFIKKGDSIDTEPFHVLSVINGENEVSEKVNCNKLLHFELGKYYSTVDYSLSLNPNKNYELKFDEVLLSKGIWDAADDHLSMFDQNLKKTFKVCVKNATTLESVMLPCNYYGDLFYYRSE